MTLNETSEVKSNMTSGILDHDFIYAGNTYCNSTGNDNEDIRAPTVWRGNRLDSGLIQPRPGLIKTGYSIIWWTIINSHLRYKFEEPYPLVKAVFSKKICPFFFFLLASDILWQINLDNAARNTIKRIQGGVIQANKIQPQSRCFCCFTTAVCAVMMKANFKSRFRVLF